MSRRWQGLAWFGPFVGLVSLPIVSCTQDVEEAQVSVDPSVWTLEVEEPNAPFYVRTPLVHDDTVYVASKDGRVQALDTSTGEVRWDFQEAGWTGIDSGAYGAVAGGLFLATSDSGFALHGLETDTGTERWRFRVEEWAETEGLRVTEVVEGVAVLDEVVFLAATVCCPESGETSGVVVALDLATGQARWSAPVEDGPLAPVTAGAYVVVRTYDGRLHGLSADDGSGVWTTDIGGARLLDGSLPVVIDLLHGLQDAVLAVGENGALHAIEAASGRTRWTFDLPLTSFIAPGAIARDDVLYVTAGSHVLALEASTGRERWRLQLEDSSEWTMTGPALVSGSIYVGAASMDMLMPFHDLGRTEIRSLTLYGIDADSGVMSASHPLEDRRPIQVAGGGDTVYLVTEPTTEPGPIWVTALDVSALTEQPAPSTVQLRGRVTSGDGPPVDFATVTVVPHEPGEGRMRTRFVDAQGQYEFRGLALGVQYEVTVQARGHEPATAAETLTFREGQVEEIDVSLIPVSPSAP